MNDFNTNRQYSNFLTCLRSFSESSDRIGLKHLFRKVFQSARQLKYFSVRLLELSLQNTSAQISEVLCTQFRSQSLRYPCSAERENEVLWVIADNRGRDPFNQNFRKFRSKTQWIGSVQPEKFRKKWSTFRGGPLFSVGPVRSKWTVPFDHSDPFSIPGPRCSVSSMYKMEENTYHCTLWIVNSGSIGVTRTSL